MLYDKRIDIALTETHFTKHSYISIPSYSLLKCNNLDGGVHGGVAILIKYKLKFYQLPNFSQNYIQSCAIMITLNNIPFVISAISCPPRRNLTNNDLTNYLDTITNNFIISGDYNAKHQT